MMTKRISAVLKRLGIPVHMIGFHYLRYAIELMVEDQLLIARMTTALYPRVAERFGTSRRGVERSMRFAIDTAYRERMVEDDWDRVFGREVKKDVERPTCGEFIAVVADYLLNGECEE